MQLQVHLEGEQYIVFDDDDDRDVAAPQDTPLTAFFKANQLYAEARNIPYPDFPSHFTWDHAQRKWKVCKSGKTSGRMVFVPPNAGEKFYARLLLSVATNVCSFTDLRSFAGITYSTFREACLARGLLADDNEWRQALEDGRHMQTGSMLRQMFVTIVRKNQPSQPALLWDSFKSFLCDDLPWFLHQRIHGPLSDEITFDYGLHLIESRLRRDDRSMDSVGLPKPVRPWAELLAGMDRSRRVVFDPVEQTRMLNESLPLLNDEQRSAFSSMLTAAVHHSPYSFFLQGAAGAGKTFVYNTLCFAARSRHLEVLCVASSGIAALLLPGGRTAHSSLKIPLHIDEASTCSISKRSRLARSLAAVDLLIWDECSMQNRFAFKAVDRTLRDIRENDSLFGGITTILGGDFLQTLPVMPRGSKSDILDATLLSSPLWSFIAPHFLRLERNMRVGSDPFEQGFARWLRQLARGDLNDEDDNVIIPSDLISAGNSLAALIDSTYPAIMHPHPSDYFRERCILTPCNREANEINELLLDRFPGEVHDLWAVDEAHNPDTGMESQSPYTPEVLHGTNPPGFPLAHLKLKIGCPVIVLRNLHSDEGICNGSRGIVTRITRTVVEVRLLGGDSCLIPRVKLISIDEHLPFHLHRRQFPLALSFAVTINKSQGQSFSTVGIDLRVPAFTHGQIYVAFSRGRSRKTVKCVLNENSVPRTKNVVFKETIL